MLDRHPDRAVRTNGVQEGGWDEDKGDEMEKGRYLCTEVLRASMPSHSECND